MSNDTVEALAKFVKDHTNVKDVIITWYGGEPLLAFNQIKAIYEKFSAEDMPEVHTQGIITNGYCFNDEIIAFFKDKKCSYIQITMDGLYERHSATRCLRNSDKDTFWPIIENIDKLVKELPNTRINIRVNINKKNYKEFIAVANFMKERYPGNEMISTYPGIIREEDEEKRSLCATSFSSSEMLILNNLVRNEGYDTSDFPRRTGRGCMTQNTNAFLIGPDGEIYKCWNDVGNSNAIVGYINNIDLVNPTRYIRYTIQAIPFNDECKHCHAFPICDGGCSYHRYRNMFEGCNFDLCSPYKDKERLINALLTGDLLV